MYSKLSYLFLMFMIYSFIGYICEIISTSLIKKRLVNRGFLCGPYCPIYGLGGVFIYFALSRFKDDPITVFILGSIITSALEYFTSFILEKIFHNKWWDYTGRRFNINGRICLQNTLLFGVGALALIYVIQPVIDKFLLALSPKVVLWSSIIIAILFTIDCIYSFIVAYNLRNRIIICEELKRQKIAKLPGMLEKLTRERVDHFKLYPKRLLEAFPALKKANYKELRMMKIVRDKKHKQKKAAKNKA